MNEVSIPEEGLSEIGISEIEEGRFSEIDEWGFACWRNNAEIELDVDLVLEEENNFIKLDLKTNGSVTGWKEEIDELFDDFLDSQFRISSTEDVEYKLDDSFGHENESVSELISEVVFRLGRFAEVVGSSFFAQQRCFVYHKI